MVNSNDNYIRVFHIPDTVFNNQWDVNVELVGTETAEIRNGTQLMIRVKTGQRGVRVESGGWAWKWKNKSRKIISSACVCAFFPFFRPACVFTFGLLQPFTEPAVKCPGWKVHGRACKLSLFDAMCQFFLVHTLPQSNSSFQWSRTAFWVELTFTGTVNL